MGPENRAGQVRNIEVPKQITFPAGRGGEKLWTRLNESLGEGLKGFGAGFVGGFTAGEIVFPFILSVGMANLSSPMEFLSSITTNMTLFYTGSWSSITIVASVMGFGNGLNGAVMMGLHRFTTGSRSWQLG